MNYSEFKAEILAAFKEIYGKDCSIQIQTILKNNSISFDALTIRKNDTGLAPTIYLDDFYRHYSGGASFEEVINEIRQVYENATDDLHIDFTSICNFSQARNMITYKLINYESNHELLRTLPHRKYLDLAIVYQMILKQDNKGSATALISNEHMAIWHTDEETLFALASFNTPRILTESFLTLRCLMVKLISEELGMRPSPGPDGSLLNEDTQNLAESIISDCDPNEESELYVITNESRIYGAAAILYKDALKRAADKIGEAFYILPSSVHEVILMPQSGSLPVTSLINMVKSINESSVPAMEKLSDTIYYYDPESSVISCINSTCEQLVIR